MMDHTLEGGALNAVVSAARTTTTTDNVALTLEPLANAMRYYRSRGYLLRHERHLGSGLSWSEIRALKEDKHMVNAMDSAYSRGYWRTLCQLDKRVYVYGALSGYNTNNVTLRIPRAKRTEKVLAWVNMVGVEGTPYGYYRQPPESVAATYHMGITYIDLTIYGRRFHDLWFGEYGWVNLCRTEWAEIFRPINSGE